ncbi:DUF4176 domain-containing protein [Pseudolactococcus paracarnosus]|uniref:DUF4176 domain-containing protein n=1 Tax=Pseudolactococcus paracarnosus TaxID=2749962 RepID=A0ABT0AIT2_9LACT|nr:DUF4176 domain-containing protein [Lactococcus paracarnosus]MCJ1976436.1 DUF4176 domain-containing protein [Lactococcus paracarnosus]MCJ1983022.1 DUF4176 domain-containing protein [Lactococcus paracarnosus]MCJ1997525.1 DUF4176 domain-containing protein [Lactococcus paracarnosus]
MEKENSLLPIGSVVYLKEGTVKMVIIGRSNLLTLPEKETVLFDYSAVIYPLGYVGEKEIYFFNKNDVDKIEFKGYSDSENEQFVKNMLDYQNKPENFFIQGNVDEFLEQEKEHKNPEEQSFGF